ncbi:MAG TPA: substrate-binding domain-containing protein [Polyangia bacterium]|nr:substrate-binding domain-containing protein [Polyangia bacterium]
MTSRRRALQWLVLALAFPVAAGLAGCPKRDEAGPAPPPAPAPVQTAPPIRIAMIGKSSTNPIFLSARTGAEAAARDLSTKVGQPIEVVWLTPPQEDGALQAQRISQAVKDGVRAILISCSDADRVTAAIDDAVDHGVAVMTFDSDAPRSKRFAYYGVDDHRLGRDVMVEVSRALGGKGKIAILAGNQSAPNLQKRVDGVRDEAARHPGIQIVGTYFHVERPEAAAAEVMRVSNQHRDLRGWAMVGGWALFTKTLLAELDPAKVKLIAVDALPPELAYVEKGLAPVLLAQQPYLWGNVGVTKIVDKLVHKRDVPTIVPMDPVRVTPDTLGSWARQLRQWGFADVPEDYLRLK